MTALGKTLVFFNLLFSLVTGGLIVMVFVTRTNWKEGMDKALAEAKAARAEAVSMKNQRDAQIAEAANQSKKEQDRIRELNTQISAKDAQIATLTQQGEASRRDAAEQLAISQSQSQQIARLQQERNQKDEYLK